MSDLYDGATYGEDPALSTQQRIRETAKMFTRPVNPRPVEPSEEERVLMAKLMLEEVLEYINQGLGVKVSQMIGCCNGDLDLRDMDFDVDGDPYNLIESAGGLGDIVVIAYGNAAWEGYDLDKVVAEIDESNRSKLIECGWCEGSGVHAMDGSDLDHDPDAKCGSCHGLGKVPLINGPVGTGRFDGEGNEQEQLMDPSRPVGKWLKGPDYREPDITSVVLF